MRWALYAALVTSHAFAFLPFWRKIRQALIPGVEDFAVLSVILFYDFGIALELFGFAYPDAYFSSFFDAEPLTLLLSVAILMLAPWLFRLGAALVSRDQPVEPLRPHSALLAKRAPVFYGTVLSISLLLAAMGILNFSEYGAAWVARQEMGSEWGTLIIVFYLPLHFLAYYVRQEDSHSKAGLALCVAFVIATTLATFSIGQRMNVLMPLLILALFRFKNTLPRVVLTGAVLLVLASISLPVFKSSYSEADTKVGELVVSTLYADVSRAQLLTEALSLAEISGTSVMPYPLGGYWYSAFFFIPRSIAPFKLHSSASYFTIAILGGDAMDLDWGFGIGALEELLINAGKLWVLPGLLLYGVVMGYLGRGSARVPALVVPSRLAAFWVCGYGLPALLLLFATMGGICCLFHALFSAQPGALPDAKRAPAGPDVAMPKHWASHLGRAAGRTSPDG